MFGRGNEVRGINLGLHRIAAVTQALGSPHEKFAVLHIAGTNGKGSVAAMAEMILRTAGWKTGLYTSPHLEKLEERIRVCGRDISPRRFAAVASQVFEIEEKLFRRRRLDVRLTYFEFLTACAFLQFARERIQIAVVEVGLGGRLDATNVVRPGCCVITGVSLDHQDLLGSSLAQIAWEKAGIIKEGVPVVSGCRAPAAKSVVQAEARCMHAPLLEIDEDYSIRVVAERGPKATIDLITPNRFYQRLPLALAGLHQARNAALAVAGVEQLGAFPVRVADVRRGIAATRWPGRLDVYPARRRTLLEGAHNVEGASALCNHLTRRESGEIHLVFGAVREKDIRGMGRMLFPLARSIHLAPVANSRSANPSDIAAQHSRFRRRIRIHDSALSALHAAWEESPRDGLVVVTGSLYLLGELLPLIRADAARKRRRQPPSGEGTHSPGT